MFLEINDQINTVLNRYEAYKKGDYSAASNPIPPELSGSGGSSAQAISLIDFDDAPPQPAPSSSGAGGGGIDELASLFGPGPSQGAPATAPPPNLL